MVSSLKLSLLSTASDIFGWATNTYDGGFLNDIFDVTPKSTIALRNNTIHQVINDIIYQNLFGGGRYNVEVYRWLPADLRNGDEVSHQVAVLTGVTIFLSILLLLFPLVGIILSCNYQRCYKKRDAFDTKFANHKAGPLSPHHDKDIYFDASLLGKIHVQTLQTIKPSEKNDNRIRIYHVTVFALTFVLLLGLLVIICVLFFAGTLVTEVLVDHQSTATAIAFDADDFNLLDGFKYVTNELIGFLTSGAVMGNDSSTQFLLQANSTLLGLLESLVSIAVDDLLREYGIESLIDTAKGLQNDLEVLKINMEIIRLDNQKVSADISNLVGQFKVIHGLVDPELKTTCATNMGVEIRALCSSLQSRSSILLLQFNASAIKVDPPAVLNFIFNDLGIDLEKILEQFDQLTSKVREIKDQVLAKVSSLLDFNSYFSFITDLWTTVINETTTLNATLTNFTTQLADGLGNKRILAYVMVNGPICVLLVIFIAHLVIAVLYAVEAKRTKLFYMNENTSAASSKVCNNCGSLIHAILFIALLTATAVCIIIVLPLCVLIVSNGCVYLTDQRGIQQSDCVLDSFMATELWPKVLNQIRAATSVQINDFLVLRSPQNVINALTVSCKQRNVDTQLGLLKAIGWTTFISVSSLLNSKEMTDQINEGEKLIKEEIVKMNLASLIPKDLDQLMKTAQNLTQYFDRMNYQPSIDELSPDRLPVADLTKFADDLEMLNIKILQAGLPVSPILQTSVDLVRNSLTHLSTVRLEAQRLRDAFIAVQTRRNLTDTVTLLVRGIEEVQVILNDEAALLAPVSEVYVLLVNKLKVNLEVDLDPIIQAFVHELFPCSRLYAASNAALTMICLKSGEISRIVAWTIILAIALIISTLLFFSLFHLGFVQAHHFQQLTKKLYQPNPSRFLPQNQYFSMPVNNLAPVATVKPTSLFYDQNMPPPSTMYQPNPHTEITAPSLYEHVEQQEINLSESRSASDMGMADSILEHSETELPLNKPVPLPRSGNRFLKIEAREGEEEEYEMCDEDEDDQKSSIEEEREGRMEDELEEDRIDEEEEESQRSERRAQNLGQPLHNQVFDHDI